MEYSTKEKVVNSFLVLEGLEILEGLVKTHTRRKHQKHWNCPWLASGLVGQARVLVFTDIKNMDDEEFTWSFRMSKPIFYMLLDKITHRIMEAHSLKASNFS